MAVDSNGNTYITGTFNNSIDFGGSKLGKTGSIDAYLASFTPGGKHRWSKAFGGPGSDHSHDAAVDSSCGNVYITGTFTSSINFGGSTLSCKGTYDVFMASFDSSGKHRWSKVTVHGGRCRGIRHVRFG